MILILILSILNNFSFNNFSQPTKTPTECEVVEFYEVVNNDQNFKVLTASGEIAEVVMILKPVRMDEGKHEVEITRKAQNLYIINQTKYCFETQYCFEQANYDKATLVVTGNFGNVKGKITFK